MQKQLAESEWARAGAILKHCKAGTTKKKRLIYQRNQIRFPQIHIWITYIPKAVTEFEKTNEALQKANDELSERNEHLHQIFLKLLAAEVALRAKVDWLSDEVHLSNARRFHAEAMAGSRLSARALQ